MRLNFLKWLCANVLLGILIISTHTMAQTNYNVPITLSVSNTAIDRVIGAQWASITHSWSGPFYWSTYTLTLNHPVIILADNAIKISMGLTVASPIYNGTFTIMPTLTVPPTTITANNIITQYQDLQQQINNYISDNGLRSTIYQDLSSISWIVYQGQIMNASTMRVSDITDIKLNGLPTLSFSVSSNNLNVTVSETITATTPSYKLKSENYGGHLLLRFESDVNFTSRSIKVAYQNGGYSWNETVNRASTYDATQGIYYLEVQTNENAGVYDFSTGLLQWAFYRGGNEVIRRAVSPKAITAREARSIAISRNGRNTL